jgi:hypothetical protein
VFSARFLTGLVVAIGSAAPVADEELLRQAAAAFRRGVEERARPADARPHFREAVRLYDLLAARGLQSATMEQNRGNAALLAGDLPHAIRAYRRGLALAPEDAELQANLAYARAQVAYPAPPPFARPRVSDRPPWLPRVTWPVLLALALLCHVVLCVAATRWYMTRRDSSLTVALAALVGVVALLLSLAHERQRLADERDHPLVVIAADGVLMRSGNGLSYPSRYETPLNRGVEARLRFLRGDWLQVELSGGEVGWVPGAVALVEE